MDIIKADLEAQQIISLVETHKNLAMHACDPCADHALDMADFADPDITLWALWQDGRAVGIGALKQLDDRSGEVKTMFTHPDYRGQGLGVVMLKHLITQARDLKLSALYLETGSWDYFIPARALYRKFGFSDCPPFGAYQAHPDSTFMYRPITQNSHGL